MAKKEQKSVLPLIGGAVGLGIVAALMAMLYLNAKEAQLKAKYEQDQERTITVVVANKDLAKGREITLADFSARAVPMEFVHDDAVYPNDFERYVGRSIIANIGEGKTLLKSFVDDDFPRDFSDIIPPGKRAITITVDDINSIGGFLRPGNRIDIYVNIPFSTSGFQPALFTAAREAGALELLPESVLSEIPPELMQVAASVEDPTALIGALTPSDVIIPVLQNIKVLATGKDPYRETLDALRQPQRRTESQFSNITIEVDAEQAALVTLAQDNGEIVSLLRNRNDQGASSFTNVSPLDLFGNAAEMANAEKERASRVTEAAGVDVNGNLVDADGNKLMSRDQLAEAGYSVNENGQIVDKDGNVVDPNDLVIAADGSVINKQALAAAGLSVNESGQIVDANGNLVDANDVVIADDGSIMTKQQLAGLSVNENGEIVDANGRVVSANDMVTTADGTVMTKDQLAKAGLSMNENGEIVDKDGNVVNPDDMIVAADGSILSKEQLASAGYTVNENGEIVDSSGNVVEPGNIVIAEDGSIQIKLAPAPTEYELIIGGNSQDGVAKSKTVAVPADKPVEAD